MFACLTYYIHHEPVCHKYFTEYSDGFQQQVDCKFYRKTLLPFFNASAKIERGKKQENQKQGKYREVKRNVLRLVTMANSYLVINFKAVF